MRNDISRLNKYLPLRLGSFKGFLECVFEEDGRGAVNFKLIFSQVRNTPIFDNVCKELEKNLSNYNLIKVVDREVKKVVEYTYLQAINLRVDLDKELNSYLNGAQNPMGTHDIVLNCIKDVSNVSLPANKAMVLSSLVGYYVDNYNSIQMATIEDQSIACDDNEIINVIDTTSKDEGLFKAIVDVLKIPSVVHAFIYKQINNKNLAVYIEEKSDPSLPITLYHTPLYNFNLFKKSRCHTTQILSLVNNLNHNHGSEISFTMRSIVRQLNYIISNKNKLTPHNEYEYNVVVVVLITLFYLYIIKMNEAKFIGMCWERKGLDYLSGLNYGFKHVSDIHGVKRQIEFACTNDESKTVKMSQQLSKTLSQYRYLEVMDSNLFKEKVLEEYYSPSEEKKDFQIPINNGVIVDIENFFSPPPTELNKDDFLFKLKWSHNRDYYKYSRGNQMVISIPFLQYLKIDENATYSKLLLKDSPLRLLMTIIIEIINEITIKNRLMYEHVTSTAQMYTLLKPYDIDDKQKMFLVYQIIIPCLYMHFKIHKIIDNFYL